MVVLNSSLLILFRVAEIKALQAKKEALISAGEGVMGLQQEGIKEEGVVKVEDIKLEVTGGVGDLGGEGSNMSGMEGELGIGGSPDSGASSESSSGKLMELKGKSDAAKIEQLQKVCTVLVYCTVLYVLWYRA